MILEVLMNASIKSEKEDTMVTVSLNNTRNQISSEN